MDTLKIERRTKATWGTFFPEAVIKERETWGQTIAGVESRWLKYKLLTGPDNALQLIRDKAKVVAAAYSSERKKFPFIDALRMFEGTTHIQSVGLEYWDYAGRIDTTARESVNYQFASGRRAALPRDSGTGFRGIVTMSESPWSMESFAMREIAMNRVRILNLGRTFLPSKLTTREPWRLRGAAERQLKDLQALAWSDYSTEPTAEKLNTVVGIETVIYRYVLDSLSWQQCQGLWETTSPVPFPDKATALRLWEQDKIDDLHYDQTYPWWDELPKEPVSQVTAFRRAYLTTGRVSLAITPNPMLHVLRHPKMSVQHQLLTYGQNKVIGTSRANTNEKEWARGQAWKGTINTTNWNGEIAVPPAWQTIQGEGLVPEPKINVSNRVVQIGRKEAEILRSAISSDKPTLVNLPLNDGIAPILVMPRLFWQVLIVPLFDGGRQFRPLQTGNTIEGWAINSTSKAQASSTRELFASVPAGFLETPLSGRAIREGALQEVLPYA